jgi:hypothetical protein
MDRASPSQSDIPITARLAHILVIWPAVLCWNIPNILPTIAYEPAFPVVVVRSPNLPFPLPQRFLGFGLNVIYEKDCKFQRRTPNSFAGHPF